MMGAPFGVSNVAWPPADLPEALDLLRDAGCTSVEIAPFNVFGRWHDLDTEARTLRDQIESRGLICSALQGILYQAEGVELFASEASRTRLQHHLEKIATLANLLGAKACVFGAPRQRDPGTLDPAQAWDIAVTTLRRCAPAFAAAGTTLAFEANARQYGCRFVTTTAQAVDLVAAIDQPGIGLQIDTGTIILESEPLEILAAAARHAVHAHISEPDLQPLGAVDHTPIAAALRNSGYTGSLSIEMRNTETWRTTIPAAIAYVQAAYR